MNRSTASCPFPALSVRAPSMCSSSFKISALISLSSTINILLPVKSKRLPGMVSGSLFSSWLSPASPISSSTSTVKVLPFPGALSTWILPPIKSSMLFAMAMPSPVPWVWFPSFSSILVNGRKMVFKNSSVIPRPVSFMIKRYLA